MRLKLATLLAGLVLLMTTGCRELLDIFDDAQPRKIEVKDFVSGLASPIGLAVDPKGHVWVTEIGTGNNDGKVTMITENGTKYTVIDGFPSEINEQEGVPAGLNHLLVKDDILYILHSFGKMYKFDLHSFHPGDKPVQADDLQTEDIGPFVVDYKFEDDAEESNPYNLIIGPEKDIFIVDAAANAIIRRSKTGKLSVFATFPNIQNSLPFGPPMIHSVPTGIAFDGQRFFVSTLTGFPFPTGKARIYQVNLAGNVSVYREGFTMLTDINLDAKHQPLALQFAEFGEQGFKPNTGRLTRVAPDKNTVLVDKLNLPTSIARRNTNTYYVNSLAEGKIMKVLNVY
jgi:DNA-binding beta-propeller fold protein YncE